MPKARVVYVRDNGVLKMALRDEMRTVRRRVKLAGHVENLVAVFLETDPCLEPFKVLARDLKSTFEGVLEADSEAD